LPRREGPLKTCREGKKQKKTGPILGEKKSSFFAAREKEKEVGKVAGEGASPYRE